jgi:AraC-like DNA-binding protein
MIQLAGTTAARQQRRACLLRAGDSCAIDNGAPFELEVSEGISNLIILQIPRLAVLGRHPYLERCTAERFDAHEAGTGLLRSLLMSSLDGAAALEDQQRSAALAAIIELLGAARCVRSEPPEEQVGWRIRAAQQLIGEHFADPALNASQIARVQGISRRRLDTLMIRATGGTLTAQIWNRRLAQAANDLDDPRCAARGVSQLAFAAGFVDSAHFSRAFRRAFQCTPSEWRERRRNDATDRSAPQTPPRPTLRPRAVRR